MDLSKLLTLIALHKWLLVVAVVVGFLVRQVKPDAALPVDVPARFRPLVAVLLGLVAGGCDALVAGTPWKEALLTGVSGALLAILGHVFGIEVLRGGKELPPLGKKSGGPPAAGGGAALMLLASMAISSTACDALKPKSPLDFAKASCIAANAFLDVKALRLVCDGLDGVTDDDLKALLASHRAGASKMGAAQCGGDAGAK